MGKKSKKKASSSKNNNKRSATNEASVLPNVSSGAAGAAGYHDLGTTTDDNNSNARAQIPDQSTGSGIYATYKKCTEAVKEWAMLSLKGQDKRNKKPRHKQEATKQLPLSTVLANLHALAASDTVMPAPIFRDLKVAIRLRRQASAYYYQYYFHHDEHDGSSASSCRDGHGWIIGQLVLVYRAFCDAARRCRQRQTNDAEKKAGKVETFDEDDDDGIAHVENRFAALAGQYGEDESSLEDEDDAVTATFVHNNSAPQFDPSSETMVQEEERHFAIACALLEVEKLRQDIRKCWQDWATASTTTAPTTTPSTQQETTPATVTARALLEACCVSRYAILMAKSSIISTCVAFDAFREFDEILHNKSQPPSTTGKQNNTARVKKHKFEMGQHVIIAGLVAKPAFNHQCGTICSIVSDVCDRYGVQISNDGKVLAVKPENLLLSDDLLVGLHQVYEAMSSFNFTCAVPSVESKINSPQQEVQKACVSLLSESFEMENAIRRRDRRALLHFMIKDFFPLWMAFGDYAGDFGPADSLFRAYLRDFRSQRTIQFHWVVFLLCMTDSCFDCYCVNKDAHEVAVNSMDAVLRDVCDYKVYTVGISVLDTSEGGKSQGLWSHRQMIHDIRNVWNPIATFFPWISGDLLLQGLRLNFVAAAGLPYHFWEEYMTLLHLYSMLRQEKYIAPIPDIDNTLIRMYRKQVFFRSGVPKPGTESYLSSWQVSVGANAQSVSALKGDRVHRGAGVSKYAEDRSGLHVTEMSRLLGIVQWQDVGVTADPSVCFDEIRKVVRDEFDVLFLAPLMMTSVRMNRLERLLVAKCAAEPRAFGQRWIGDYERILSQLKPAPAVCFWALALADGRSLDQLEIRRGLVMVASCFGDVFGQQYLVSSSSVPFPPFEFNPNEHAVSAALWGTKGAQMYGQMNKL